MRIQSQSQPEDMKTRMSHAFEVTSMHFMCSYFKTKLNEISPSSGIILYSCSIMITSFTVITTVNNPLLQEFAQSLPGTLTLIGRCNENCNPFCLTCYRQYITCEIKINYQPCCFILLRYKMYIILLHCTCNLVICTYIQLQSAARYILVKLQQNHQ